MLQMHFLILLDPGGFGLGLLFGEVRLAPGLALRGAIDGNRGLRASAREFLLRCTGYAQAAAARLPMMRCRVMTA